MPSGALAPGIAPHEQMETTHYSVMDREGNAVAVTYTLNGSFGAGVMAGDTGFLLNDEMDDFTIKPGLSNLFGMVQGEANAISPGKRPLSSMAPTVVLHDGRVLVLGSAGGPRIITVILETALNILDYGIAFHQNFVWQPLVVQARRVDCLLGRHVMPSGRRSSAPTPALTASDVSLRFADRVSIQRMQYQRRHFRQALW